MSSLAAWPSAPSGTPRRALSSLPGALGLSEVKLLRWSLRGHLPVWFWCSASAGAAASSSERSWALGRTD